MVRLLLLRPAAFTAEGSSAVGDIDKAPVLDELGNEISLPLVCEDPGEQWLSVLDPATGNQLNIQTIEGQLIATLEDGSPIALSEQGQPLTVLDEAGNILTIPLQAITA